jgi:hypothetical protein
MVCLLIRTTAQILIWMQDGPLWTRAHQFLTAISHWCEIQASKRRARYVVATGVLLAVVGCAWALGQSIHRLQQQTEPPKDIAETCSHCPPAVDLIARAAKPRQA